MEFDKDTSELYESKIVSEKEDLINHIALIFTMVLVFGFFCWFCWDELDKQWLGVYSILVLFVMCIGAWYSWKSGDCRKG